VTTSKAHSRPGETEGRAATLGRAEQRATIVGSIAGGLAGVGGFYATMAPHQWLYVRYVALVLGIGPGSRTRGVVAFLLLAGLFGGVFGAFVGRYGGSIAGGLMAFARSNPLTRLLLGPLFTRVPLTTTTTLVGAVYGALLGVTVGRIVVPALVAGATPFTYELSRSDPGILIGFVAYGTVLGLGFGVSRENATPSVPIGAGLFGNRSRALAFGPLVGALAGAAAFSVLARGHLASLALVADVAPTPARALAVWAGLAAVLSLAFVLVVPRFVSRGTGYVGGLAAAGFVYGILLAIGLGMVAVPQYTTRLTEWTILVPSVTLGTTVGYLAYGTFLGGAYGNARQYGRVLPRAVAEHRDAVLFSALIGGALGGGIIYQAAGRAQLLFYGALVGSPGSVPRAWAVWLALTVLLALFFVAVVRPRGDEQGYVWRSTRRGALFGLGAGLVLGAVVVPGIVDASTRFVMPVPFVEPMILLGYTVAGAVVGLGYGASVEEAGLAVDADRTKGAVFGALLGGFLGGLVVHHLSGPLHIQLVGAFGGVESSMAKSWATWMVLAFVLAVGFARIVSRSLGAYVDALERSISENPDVAALVRPAFDRAPLTTAAAGIGAGYGAVAGVVVGLLGVPMLVTWFVPVYQVPVPTMDLAVFLGYTVYGLFLGTGYGVVVEF
jgi:hypothetical protein